MGGCSPKKLFLLEFLVDKVSLKESDTGRLEEDIYHSLLVSAKIENFLCLDINQDALKKEQTHLGVTWHFCCGKSCTFAMQPQQLLKLLKDHPCYFIVGMLDNRNMSTEMLGACKANLCSDLSDVILTAEIKSDKYPIISAVHQDTYNLRCPLGEDVGFVSILVRLTCYGLAVTTRFIRMDTDNKVYLYENKDPDPCAEMPSDEEEESGTSFSSDDGMHIFKEGATYNYVCKFDKGEKPDMPEEGYDQDTTIVCTNNPEFLPESSFQRRFPDDTVPFTPLISNYEDDNLEDEELECTCLREMQLNEMCRTMFLCDRSQGRQVEQEPKVEALEPKAEALEPEAAALEPEVTPAPVYHQSHPPVRYNTTSCLTAAYGGQRPVPLGALVQLEDEETSLPNPPVRYDTTGALSPAFLGVHDTPPVAPSPEQPSVASSATVEYQPEDYMPVQHHTSTVTCRCWCTCYSSQVQEEDDDLSAVYHPSNPPVRYDTTGALTVAHGGHRPVPLGALVQVADDKKDLPHPAVRYDTTGALSPAFKGDHILPRAPRIRDPFYCRFVVPIPSLAFPNRKIQPWKKDWTYFYNIGDKHPGFKRGHGACVPEFKKVPDRVSWSSELRSMPTWRPGAIAKNLPEMFKELRLDAGLEVKRKRRKKMSSRAKARAKAAPDPEVRKKKSGGVELPPTLHIHEQEGNYYIAMQPVHLYPEHLNVPLQFKIPIPKRRAVDHLETQSDLQLDYRVPAVYWPAQPQTSTVEIQCDSSMFPDPTPVQVLLEPPKRGPPVNSQIESWDKDTATAVGRLK